MLRHKLASMENGPYDVVSLNDPTFVIRIYGVFECMSRNGVLALRRVELSARSEETGHIGTYSRLAAPAMVCARDVSVNESPDFEENFVMKS